MTILRNYLLFKAIDYWYLAGENFKDECVMPENSITPYIAYIAGYAAVISTLTFIWNIIQWFKQKGKLRVEAAICKDIGRNKTMEVNPGEWGDVLRVDIVNVGKADVTVEKIYFTIEKPNRWQFWKKPPHGFLESTASRPFPYTLEESRSADWLYEDFGVLSVFKIRKFFVKDTHGRNWHISKRQLKHMRKVLLHMEVLWPKNKLLLV